MNKEVKLESEKNLNMVTPSRFENGQAQSINQATRFAGFLSVGSLGTVIIVCLIFAVAFINYHKYNTQKAFFVTNESAYAATSLNSLEQREKEVRYHIKKFYSLMYTFDAGNYESNITAGAELIGREGAAIINNYNKENTHDKLITYHGYARAFVDSIDVKMNTVPYKARAFITQEFTNDGGTQILRLVFDMDLHDVSRTDRNINGLLIKNYNPIYQEVISNEQE